jgi:hypothetical protein
VDPGPAAVPEAAQAATATRAGPFRGAAEGPSGRPGQELPLGPVPGAGRSGADWLRTHRVALSAIALLLIAAAAIGAIALGHGNDKGRNTAARPTHGQRSVSPSNPPPSSGVSTSQAVGTWPGGKEGWTAIIASKQSRAEAEAAAAQASDLATTVGILRSDDYTTLNPGYWVAFVGDYSSAPEADSQLPALGRRGFTDAYVRFISQARQDPSGTLTATSIGPVPVGATMVEVSHYFTAPDRKVPVNLGGGPTPEDDWTWDFPDGTVTLFFATNSGRLAGYDCSTPALATISGFRVGDSFAPIRQRYRDQLRASPTGSQAFLLSEGKPGSYPALTFILAGSSVSSISGGAFHPAGE